MSLKHYVLQERLYQGYTIYRLIKASDLNPGEEHLIFSMFMEDLVNNGHRKNNLRNYAYRLANFLDYIYEGEIFFRGFNTEILHSLIVGYHSYLVFGQKAQAHHIKSIATTRPIKQVNEATSVSYHAPIKQFITASHIYHSRMLDQQSAGLQSAHILDPQLLFYSGFDRTSLPVYQRRAINNYSLIAGVVNGGAKMARENLFRHLPKISSSDQSYDDNQHFPFEKISTVIGHATSFRNAALWALIAATGLRASEALQIIWDDIDFDDFQVSAVNPNDRKNISISYKGLSEIEIKRLTWKGRKSKYTLMLEPYSTLFFESLRKYIQTEYIAHDRHNFVFQKKDGSPLFLSDYGSTILEPFHIAQKKMNSGKNEVVYKSDYEPKSHTDSDYGLHSLRHSFCVFLKNFAKNLDDTYGFTDSQIMLLTGHSDVRSVERYAKVDKLILNSMIAQANYAILGDGIKSTEEYQLDYLKRRMKKLKAQLETSQISDNKGNSHD